MLSAARFINNRLSRIAVNQWRASSGASTFYHKDLVIQKTDEPRSKPVTDDIAFGSTFSDHMFTCRWTSQGGWERPYIKKLTNLSMHPASKVFHYAQELFEGMKAYRSTNGDVHLFRPELNFQRMLIGTDYCSLPSFDADQLLLCLKSFIALERDWVPKKPGMSLYIRPTMIGVEPTLGVNASNEVLLFIIVGPIAGYMTNNPSSISLQVSSDRVRSFEGGVGHVKMGSNYAPTLKPTSEAQKHDCQQILWLSPPHKRIAEVGSMNIFIHWTNQKGEEELFTPALDGTILPGVTRQSILELARDLNEIKCTEGHMTIDELTTAIDQRRVHAIVGSGTACVGLPVHRRVYDGREFLVPVANEQSVVSRLWQELLDIQYGLKGEHPWTMKVVS